MTFKIISICISIFLFIGMCASCSIAETNDFFPKYFVGGSGAGNFSSISEAISQAPAYAQILVFPGSYNESIDLYKPLYVKSIVPYQAKIYFSGSDDTIEITSDRCIFEGFNITHTTGEGYTSITVTGNYNTIQNNVLYKNPKQGLYLFNCKHNIIKDNAFFNDGIIIVGDATEWSTHTFINNTANNKDILVLKNKNNFTITNTSYGQIILINCSQVYINNCSVDTSDQGIVLGHCNLCTVQNNSIVQTLYAIHLSYSKNCSVLSNMIQKNDYGIYIIHSNQNVVTKNLLINQSKYGVFICCNSKNNKLYMNTFINNTHSAYDLFSNVWHQNNIGNYWSDYSGSDLNNDGIGDNDYFIDGDTAFDPYPLVNSSYSFTDFNKSSKQTPLDSLILFLISIIFMLYLQWKKHIL